VASLPEYLVDQDFEQILQRILDRLPDDLDKSEGSFVYDICAAIAAELAQDAIWAQQVLERGFAQTTFGQYLDLRAEEHGITRRPAVAATGTVTFSGTQGTVIPAGTQVSTASTDTSPAIVFQTTQDAVIGASGTVDVPIQAVEPGASGNVAAGAIQFLVEPVPGVTGVSNAAPTSGGLDEEDDASLLARYLQRVRNPSAGGNRADYVAWAMEVPGVGGVSVVPVRDGPGTVSVVIIDTDKRPASQELVDKVQDYIAPPWVNTVEAEDLTLGGSGASVDDTQPDATGTCVRLAYDPAGPATITHAGLHTLLQQPGIWQVRLRVKVDDATGTADLLQVGVWNVSANAWAKTRPGGTDDAVVTLRAADLSTSFDELRARVEFYWNSVDELELRITRLQADTATTVWVDRVTYRSTFSKDTGEGRAPIGARVTVEPATAVLISVSATLTIAPGYNADSVKAAVQQSIADYLRSLAFQADNDVRYVRIGQAILDTPGVQDYQNLLVNGGTANVPIGEQEVAVLGTVTLTT